jgi:uncharacterized SAM-binding protein YcdF (DUF218 family)
MVIGLARLVSLPSVPAIGQINFMSLASLPTLLLIPPLNCLAAACVGAALYRQRAGRWLLGIGLAGLVALCVPLVSETLLGSLERGAWPAVDSHDPPGAIVILSGNSYAVQTREGTGFTVGWLTLERERYGARLARASLLPVLVTGGSIEPGQPSLASLMAASLHEDFAVVPKWLEERSQDTWENARLSAAILRGAGVGSVYVVTHAWHMRRALMAFRAAGLRAVPAPVPPNAPPQLAWRSLLPRAAAWEQSYFAIHEWIGCAWYALRG